MLIKEIYCELLHKGKVVWTCSVDMDGETPAVRPGITYDFAQLVHEDGRQIQWYSYSHDITVGESVDDSFHVITWENIIW